MRSGVLRQVRVCLAVTALAGFLYSGCSNAGDTNDGGTADADGGLDQCAVDDSRMRPATEPDWELPPDGGSAMGFICPKGDVDHYWFTIASPNTILSVDLSNNVIRSDVDLCYKILPENENDPAIDLVCDYDGTDGMTDLRYSHCLADAGTYFIEVYDAADNDEDPRNAYVVGLSQVVDPDGNEPNNDKDHATHLAASTEGYISFRGDMDWFRVEVGSAGQIMTIDLTTAEAGPVDLRYTLYLADGETPVNTGVNGNGMSGPTALSDVLAVPEPGTYFLVVIDEGHDESDLEVGYSLQVGLQQNPDDRDRNDPNDMPMDATQITSGVPVTGAYLATRADQDWYRIEAAGVTDSDPALLEIDLVFDGSTAVDAAVDLIVGDPNTPCSQGDACDVLNWSCGGGSCTSAACRNAQCPSHECLEHENLCSGAGFCLPEGGCGIRHLIMHGAGWSTVGTPSHLHTVAPMYGSVYYILVRDFGGDDLDLDTSYDLTVTVRPEPDLNERPPNGVYLPYATDEQDEASRRWNLPLATPVPCSEQGPPGEEYIECGPITGFLSFRGDQDWFRLDAIPTEDEQTPEDLSTKVDYDLQFDWSFMGSPELFINYTVFLGSAADRDMRTGWNHRGPGSGVFGETECSYLCGEYHGGRPVYMRVQHSDRKEWDYDEPYNVDWIRAFRLCPLNCEYCDPAATDWACPTPDNPCPLGDCQ